MPSDSLGLNTRLPARSPTGADNEQPTRLDNNSAADATRRPLPSAPDSASHQHTSAVSTHVCPRPAAVCRNSDQQSAAIDTGRATVGLPCPCLSRSSAHNFALQIRKQPALSRLQVCSRRPRWEPGLPPVESGRSATGLFAVSHLVIPTVRWTPVDHSQAGHHPTYPHGTPQRQLRLSATSHCALRGK